MPRLVRNYSTLVFAAIIVLCLAVRVAPAAASPAGSVPTGVSPAPDPALNPTALLQVGGDYSYAAAGTALRNTGSGVITLSYTGSVVAAYLIWGIINPTSTGLDAA